MAEGLAREGFDIDLLEGKAREDAFAHLITRARVEVKSDRIARRTGNVFVEYEQKSRPSGILTTTADWWTFEVNDECYLFVPTARVKAVARYVYDTYPERVKDGGDFNRYRGVLVPVDWLWRMGLTVERVSDARAMDDAP